MTAQIYRLFYTHSRSKALLEAKGIRVKQIERVAITKPDGSHQWRSLLYFYFVQRIFECCNAESPG